jgi:hypothetical protein
MDILCAEGRVMVDDRRALVELLTQAELNSMDRGDYRYVQCLVFFDGLCLFCIFWSI